MKDLEKKIFLNTFWQVAGKILTSGLGLISAILLARYFGVVGFGKYNLIFTFLGLTAIFSDFGLGTLLIREKAAGRANDDYFAGVFTLRTFFSLILILISPLLLYLFPYSIEIKQGIFLVMTGSLFLQLSSVIWAVFQAKLQFLKVVLIQILSSFSIFLLVILGIKNSLPLVYFAAATAVTNLLGLGLSLIIGRQKRYWSFNFEAMKKILIEVWPIGVWAIVSTYYFKIDTLLLSLFYNPSKFPDLGLYSAAYKYFEVAGVLAGYYQLTIYPIIASELKKPDFKKLIKRLYEVSILLALIAWLGLSLVTPQLVKVLGINFLPAVGSLRILTISLAFSILAGVWVSTAIAGGKQKQILKYAFWALFLNFALNIVFIPDFSFIAASWTTVLTQIFITVTGWKVAKEVIDEREG